MTTPLEIIRNTYENAPKENARHLRAALAADAHWTEAAGFPYAGTYVGADAIFANVFERLASEWEGYQAKVHTYLADGEWVAAFGVYSGRYRKTGNTMQAAFAHLYRFQDSKIVRMEQVVDSAMVVRALQAD
ncbi:nuclear transport factor 2 family protein [Xanthomonas hortorum]|uniref:Nuclear transport factor 2 family protein n=1 Tax=Xanthomonas hortorum TaxID=56454 RepID=A0AA47ID40_9XANT|nr:nuclear transport factor 2 family protein [Xanthomonas hortorum]WAH65509.1 nuclear transport factor 2 family protein [Xanthomonas hortorum]